MDETLKQRLVGTSILVILAVIFLPMLLDGGGMQKAKTQLDLDLPAADAHNTVTLTLSPQAASPTSPVFQDRAVIDRTSSNDIQPDNIQPIQQSQSDQIAEPQNMPETAQLSLETPKDPAEGEKIVTLPKSEQTAQPATKPTPPSAPKQTDTGGQWIVQIGSFSQKDNAIALRDRLKANAYHSFVEASGQGSQTRYRVRVGPVASRAEADALRLQLKTKEQRDGLVMGYP